MLSINDNKFKEVWQRFYSEYRWSMAALLRGELKQMYYYGYGASGELILTREDLSDLINDMYCEHWPDFLASTLDPRFGKGRDILEDVISRMAADGADRAAQEYFDSRLDLQEQVA